jgi:flagellar motor switch protein FliM
MTSVAFGDFCRSIPLPASFNLFKMEPLRGVSMIVWTGPWCLLCRPFLGGRGEKHVKLEGRNFTPIELRIIEKIVKGLLDGLPGMVGCSKTARGLSPMRDRSPVR